MRPLPHEREPADDLPPMKVNTVTMVLVGIGVWVVVLAVALVMRATGSAVSDGFVRVCGAGIILGVLALGWAIPQHRRDLRAEAARTATSDAAATTAPEDRSA